MSGFIKIFCILSLLQKVASQAVEQELKYVSSLSNTNPALVSQFSATGNPATAPNPNTMLQFQNAAGICAIGIWALYTQQGYGEGQDANTTVISMKSADKSICYPASQLNSVVSINYLGNADTTMPGISIFTNPFFLGGRLRVVQNLSFPTVDTGTGPTGMGLGSFGITGRSVVKLCGDSACMTGLCIDMTTAPGGLFMVKNTWTDTSRPWPRIIRGIMFFTTLVQCQP